MNRVIETADGFDCIVDGKQFGTWRSRREASAGMATEIGRAKAREDAESERQMALVDAEVQRHHEWCNRD